MGRVPGATIAGRCPAPGSGTTLLQRSRTVRAPSTLGEGGEHSEPTHSSVREGDPGGGRSGLSPPCQDRDRSPAEWLPIGATPEKRHSPPAGREEGGSPSGSRPTGRRRLLGPNPGIAGTGAARHPASQSAPDCKRQARRSDHRRGARRGWQTQARQEASDGSVSLAASGASLPGPGTPMETGRSDLLRTRRVPRWSVRVSS